MVNDFEKKLKNEFVHMMKTQMEVISEIVESQERQIINQNNTLSRIEIYLEKIDKTLHYTGYHTQRILENTNQNTDSTYNVVELLKLILEQQKETNTLLKDLCDKKE